jgi:hypothetical protein
MQYVLLPAIATVAVGSLALLGRRAGEGLAMRRGSIHRLLLLTSMLVLVAVAVPWHFFRGPAPRFLEVNNYHAVYAGLLQVTGEPDRALRSLGIPIEHRDLPRRDVWSADLPAGHPVPEHLRDLSRWRLLALYLADPEAIEATADRIGRSLSTVETHRRGSFPRDVGRRKGAQYTVPWQFSRLRGLVFGSWPAAVWLLLGLAAVWLVISALRGRWGGREACGLFLALFAASQVAVVILGDGFVALEQHLLAARFALDLLLLLLAYQGVSAMSALFAQGWWRSLGGRRQSR